MPKTISIMANLKLQSISQGCFSSENYQRLLTENIIESQITLQACFDLKKCAYHNFDIVKTNTDIDILRQGCDCKFKGVKYLSNILKHLDQAELTRLLFLPKYILNNNHNLDNCNYLALIYGFESLREQFGNVSVDNKGSLVITTDHIDRYIEKLKMKGKLDDELRKEYYKISDDSSKEIIRAKNKKAFDKNNLNNGISYDNLYENEMKYFVRGNKNKKNNSKDSKIENQRQISKHAIPEKSKNGKKEAEKDAKKTSDNCYGTAASTKNFLSPTNRLFHTQRVDSFGKTRETDIKTFLSFKNEAKYNRNKYEPRKRPINPLDKYTTDSKIKDAPKTTVSIPNKDQDTKKSISIQEVNKDIVEIKAIENPKNKDKDLNDKSDAPIKITQPLEVSKTDNGTSTSKKTSPKVSFSKDPPRDLFIDSLNTVPHKFYLPILANKYRQASLDDNIGDYSISQPQAMININNQQKNEKNDSSKSNPQILDTVSDYTEPEHDGYKIKATVSTKMIEKESETPSESLKSDKWTARFIRPDINIKNIRKTAKTLNCETNSFSYIKLDEMTCRTAHSLQYCAIKMLKPPKNFARILCKRISAPFKCFDVQYPTEPEITNDRVFVAMEYLLQVGPIDTVFWERSFLQKEPEKIDSLAKYFQNQDHTLELHGVSEPTIFHGVVEFCRTYLKGLIDYRLFDKKVEFFYTTHYNQYDMLVSFRDLSFSSVKRRLLNYILSYIRMQVANSDTTDWTQNDGINFLKRCMIPAEFYQESLKMSSQCENLWFTSLYKQGSVVYMPKWCEGYEIAVDSKYVEFARIN